VNPQVIVGLIGLAWWISEHLRFYVWSD